ncbi:MAG TPA: hypothetical protein VJT31_34955 [Rugosimonospora sp.]|nr:hypothetical protein [Rugosimonospora sp.]
MAERERFTAELLAALPAPDEDPVSTTVLGDRFRLGPYERSTRLWHTLDQLARSGLVQRVVVPNVTARSWRLTQAGQARRQADNRGR